MGGIAKAFLIFIVGVPVIAAVVFAYIVISAFNSPAPNASAAMVASAPAQPVDFSDPDHYDKNQNVPKAACQKSLPCMADQELGWTKVSCKQAIEAKAVYQVKWTDGMFHPLFSEVLDSGTSGEISIGYAGDRAQIQNQFGAFANMTYQCWWNPRTQKVTDVELAIGSLPSG